MSPLASADRAAPPRDHRLDYLRGYALFAMAVNHAGLESSAWRAVTGGGQFFVNAAEAFFFVSGFTLGFIAIGRPPARTVERLLHRAGVVYLAAVGLALGFSVLSLATPIDLWGGAGDVAGGAVLAHVLGVLTLHVDVSGSGILVSYVLYFAAAPLVLWAMHRGRTGLVVLAVIGLYVAHLVDPRLTSIGFATGRDLAANGPIFFGGVVLGYHRHAIARAWTRWRLGPVVDGIVVVLALVLLHLYLVDFAWWPALGDALGENRKLVRETTMPPLALALVALYLRAAWLLVTAAWVPLVRATGWFMLRLGRASLFTYGVHLVAMVVLFNTPGFRQDHGPVVATLLTAYFLAMIFGAVCLRDRIRTAAPGWSPRVRAVVARAPIGAVAVLVVACALLSLRKPAPDSVPATVALAAE